MKYDHWTHKLTLYRDKSLEETGRVMAPEVFKYLQDLGMKWRTYGWVKKKILQIKGPGFIPVDREGQFVIDSKIRTAGLVAYGVDPRLDSQFDHWENRHWSEGPRGGTLGFHTLCEEARTRARMFKEARDNGSISNEAYIREISKKR